MGLLSFGGGKSSSSSYGQSSSYDQSQSGSESGGFSNSVGNSSQGIAFEDIFSKLYGGAANTAFGLDPSALTGQANQLFGAGAGFLDSLGGGVGQDYLEGRVSGESPVLQENIDALGSDIGKFFAEQINPEITSQAVAGGALGGGRQGVAQGIAAEGAGREFQRGVTALRSNDIAARDSAAGVLGQQRNNAAGIGLSSLTGLADVAQFGANASLSPYAALASILGGPTTLTQSSSNATAEDYARAFSESFGSSQATNSSTSSSKQIKLGFS